MTNEYKWVELAVKNRKARSARTFPVAELMTPPEKPRRRIGFEVKEGRTAYRKGRKNG